MRRVRFVLAVLVFAGCLAARAKPVDFSESTKDFLAQDYPMVAENWTRHAKLVSDEGTVIEAWVTFKSWEFRQGYIEQYANVYSLADGDRADLRKSQLDESRESFEFHMIVQCTNDRWNDLDRRTSPWRVTLLDGNGNELSPKSLQPVKLPELYELPFFPNRTAFSKSYAAVFPHPAAGDESFTGTASGRLVMRIASPAGKIELAWESK